MVSHRNTLHARPRSARAAIVLCGSPYTGGGARSGSFGTRRHERAIRVPAAELLEYVVPLSLEVPPSAVKFDHKGDKQIVQFDVLGVIREGTGKPIARLGGGLISA